MTMPGPSHAMVLAAGFGTRMGDMTRDRPKPLIPVAGRALVDHVLDHCDDAGVGAAVVLVDWFSLSMPGSLG